MTVAAEDAVLLDSCLREHRLAQGSLQGSLAGLPQQFQKRLAKSNQTPWLLATSEDMRYPTTVGGKPGPTTQLMHRYMDQVLKIVPVDTKVALEFFKVLHLVASPTALFKPYILSQVARRAFQASPERELITSRPYPLQTV
jgi:hypothetical protein